MAGSKSDYLESALLNHVLGATAYTAPATVYVAAFTVVPTDAGGGTEVVTTGGTLYARVAVTNNTTNWPAATGTSPATKTNGTAINFPVAGASWGTVVAAGIFDAASGGNLLYWGDLTASKAIAANDQLTFAASSITITED
jgi:hypothetical protein